MDKYSAYLPNNNSDISNDEVVITNINEITGQTTPKEISDFVSRKLIEVIEAEINKKKKKVSEAEC